MGNNCRVFSDSKIINHLYIYYTFLNPFSGRKTNFIIYFKKVFLQRLFVTKVQIYFLINRKFYFLSLKSIKHLRPIELVRLLIQSEFDRSDEFLFIQNDYHIILTPRLVF